MKGPVRLAVLIGISLPALIVVAALSVSLSAALSGDTSADRVLGQYDFSHNIANLVDAKGIALASALWPSSSDAGWVAIDTSGATHHLYASDTLNHRVLGWLDANGFVNGAPSDLVIGQPDFLSYAANNGGQSASSLNWPLGLAVDGSGNLYVGDAGNGRVLEYDNPFAACAGNFPCVGGPAKLVFGTCGSFTENECNGGTSADTLANGIQGVAVDASGNLFVADSANHRVLEYFAPFTGGTHSGNPGFGGDTTADVVFGQSSDFAGWICNQNSNPSADTLCGPRGVSLDPSGNLFVADSGNNRVLEYLAPFVGGASSGTPGAAGDTTADVVFGQAGSFTANSEGIGAAKLNQPYSVVADTSDNIYVADGNNHRVLEFNGPVGTTPSANMVFGQNGSFTAAICGDDDYNFNAPRPSADSLCLPRGMALDGSNGNLFVVDGGGNRILKYDNPLAGGGGTPGTPGAPGDTTADGVLGQGNFNHSVPEFVDGNGLGFNVGCCGPNFNAGGVAVDRHSAPPHLYVADMYNNRVLAWRNGTSFQSGAPADLVFGQPDLLSHLCNLGIRDPGNPSHPPTNTPTADSLCKPIGVFVDNSSNLWVADFGNERVLEYLNPFAAGGATKGVPGAAGDTTADLVLGQSNLTSVQDIDYCSLGNAQYCFGGPEAVAIDNFGNAWVSDSAYNRVLEFSAPLSNGKPANKVFGQNGSFNSNNCTAFTTGINADSLCSPAGVAVDSAGNLYVSDNGNARILEYDNPLAPGDGTPGTPGAPGDTTADMVFGQAGSFTSRVCADHGVSLSADTFGCYLEQIAVDSADDLFVADAYSNRVTEFLNPKSSGGSTPSTPGSSGDTTADRVFGQLGSFTSGTPNLNLSGSGQASPDNLWSPVASAVDAEGNVYISDFGNSRVLQYQNPSAPTPTATATATETATPTATATATPTPTPLPVSLKTSTSKLNFPNMAFGNSGDPSAGKKITVSNPGGKTGMSVTFDEASTQGDFTVGQNSCTGTLAPGKKCSMMVTFIPTGLGTRVGILSISNNAANSPQHVALSGVGVAAKIVISPKTLNFPKQTISTTSSPKTIKLQNNNDVGLTVTSLASSSGEFAVNQNCVGVLAPKNKCQVSVTFTPGASGKRNAMLTINDNAAGSPHTVKLSGTGR